MKEQHRVFILWGAQEVATFYDYRAWSAEAAAAMLKNSAVYEFDTEEEAEAFRMGLCAVTVPSARDFTEITEASHEALRKLVDPPKRGKRRAA